MQLSRLRQICRGASLARLREPVIPVSLSSTAQFVRTVTRVIGCRAYKLHSLLLHGLQVFQLGATALNSRHETTASLSGKALRSQRTVNLMLPLSKVTTKRHSRSETDITAVKKKVSDLALKRATGALITAYKLNSASSAKKPKLAQRLCTYTSAISQGSTLLAAKQVMVLCRKVCNTCVALLGGHS